MAFVLLIGVIPTLYADASTPTNQTANVNEYTVNLKGNSSTRFLYNKDTTEKGVVITYTVSKITGTPGQNGVIASSTPNQSWPFGTGLNTIGQLRYNNGGADPTMLVEGVTYKCTIYQVGNNVSYEFQATTADGQEHKVNLVWPPAGTLDENTKFPYFGVWLTGEVEAELTNVSCVEKETGRDLGLATNQTADYLSITPKVNVNKYTVNLSGNSSTRFMYNEKETEKGVVITYTVSKITGTPVQNGVVASSTPNQSWPFGNGVNTTGQLRYNNGGADPTMLVEGVTYKCTIYQVGNNVSYEFQATTADGQEHKVNLVWPPAGTLDENTKFPYFGVWLTGEVEAELTNVSCVEKETGRDLGLATNQTAGELTIKKQTDVNKYTVNLKGNSSTRFLYNKKTTNKGVVITYTVKSITGTPGQNGVMATTEPTKSYPFDGGTGQLRYNNGVDPTMLVEGVTYKCTIKQNGTNVWYEFQATTADGQPHTVNIVWPPAGSLDADTSYPYFGIWLAGDVEAELINVSCVELETGRELGLATNQTTGELSISGSEDQDQDHDQEINAKKYTVNLTGNSSTRFLYNLEETEKGVVITYTVNKITGTPGQNGVMATVDPTKSYPFDGGTGQLRYNNGVEPTMLVEGVTYKFTLKQNASNVSYDITATTADGQPHEVKLQWPPAGTLDTNTVYPYYGVWLAGELEAELINVSCVELETGRDLGLDACNSTVFILGEGEEPAEVEQKTPEELGYSRVTLEDFGMAEGEYKPGMGIQGGEYAGKTLDGKYLDVNIQNSAPAATSDGSHINFAGNEPNGWYGIRFLTMEDHILVGSTFLWTPEAFEKIPFKSVGINSATEQYNLKMGVRVSEFDIVVDIWINDIRVEQMTFGSLKKQFGNYLGVYTPSTTITLSTPGSSNNVGDTKTEQLPSGFRNFTFASVGIKDGTFSKDFKDGKYPFSFNKTIFSGDVLFDAAGRSDFRYGGMANGWEGLRFWVTNSTLYMEEVYKYVDEKYEFDPVLAGVLFSEEEFNLKLSCEYVDSDSDGKKDDVKLGVWFNDVLYDNSYIYLVDYTNHIGRFICVCSSYDVEDASITIQSDKDTYIGVDYAFFGFTKKWRKELGLE